MDPLGKAASGVGLQEAMRVAAILKAESAAKRRQIGGLRALAELLGISPSAVSGWKGQVPLARVLEVEAKTGVPRHRLRPDYWAQPNEH